MSENQWLIWHLADSAFPAGGFAHSSGLEAAWQQGELREPAELEAFLESSLFQFGYASLPFMTAAYREPEALPELDFRCESFTNNHVANRASRLQGQGVLTAAARIFDSAELRPFQSGHARALQFFHLAPVFGAVLHALRLDLESATRLFLFQHLRGLIAAAVRLGLVGPMLGQTLQHRLYAPAERVLARCRHLPVSEIAQTAPLLDLWQANQDRLYSRLFQS